MGRGSEAQMRHVPAGAEASALNTMLEGRAMKILIRNGAAVLDNQARASRVEVAVRNGNIFAVSKVLVPPEVMSAIGQ